MNGFLAYFSINLEASTSVPPETEILFKSGPDIFVDQVPSYGIKYSSSYNRKTGVQFYSDKLNGLLIIVEGVILQTPEQDPSRKIYSATTPTDLEQIAAMFMEYGPKFIDKISGFFSIVIYQEHSKTCHLFSDHIGFKQLYYAQQANYLFVGSNLGELYTLLTKKSSAFDVVAMYEQLLFNYPLSSNSFIKNIHRVEAGSVVEISRSLQISRYWKATDMFKGIVYKHSDAIEVIDSALADSIKRAFSFAGKQLLLSLTGGFDGRLVLASTLKYFKGNLRLFSFGSGNSPDIKIPEDIARTESFEYQPVLTDFMYNSGEFVINALQTILGSSGTRSYRRVSNLLAMKKLGSFSPILLSGNFGDEVFKFSHLKPSEVINRNILEFVSLDYDGRRFRDHLIKLGGYPFERGSDDDELFLSRLQVISDVLREIKSPSEKFNYFKYRYIAGGYFGNEASSYSALIFNFSPFLDRSFLEAFHQTDFAGIYHQFNTTKLSYKKKSFDIYAKLIGKNYPSLLKYPTDRGYSIQDTQGNLWFFRTIFKGYLRKVNKSVNPYNLNNSASEFKRNINLEYRKVLPVSVTGFFDKCKSAGNIAEDKVDSLIYWSIITQNMTDY